MIETGAEFAMIRNSTLRMPDPDRAAKTNAGSVAAFKNMLERSLEDPDHFWAKAA